MADAPAAKKQKTSSTGSGAGKPVLHGYWRSSCSWRVRIALALKEVDYEYRAVHLVRDGGEQLKPEYTALNPNQVVPTLAIDGVTLTQSPAILEYLEETRGGAALLPQGAQARATVRTICALVGCDTQPVQNLRVLRKVMGMVGGEADAKTATKMAWGRWAISKGFDALEATLAKTAGKYCVGDELTMADLYIPPQVYNAGRFGVDMAQYPTIARVQAALEEHPAFKAAHPSAQPDAQ